MIQVIDSNVVYRNQKAHLRAVNAWHPSIALLDNGDLLSAFDLGQGPESLDYRTYLSRSKDEGKTWSAPQRWFEDPTARRTTHTCRLSRTKDGTLLGFGTRAYREDPEVGLVNHENLGLVDMDVIHVQSHDGGQTWQGPHTIKTPLVGPAFETCHSIVELQDGRWLAPTSTWRGWNGDEPNGMQAVAFVSHDRGKTWPEYMPVINGYAEGLITWEQSIVQLADGRLLALAWMFHEKSGNSFPSRYAISSDGKKFSAPQETGFLGQTAKMCRLNDGRILTLYRRQDKPGLWANLARIDGDKWVTLSEAPMWQGATAGMTGRTTPGEELSALKFGYPGMVQLANGDIFAVFWCCEDCIFNIRWLKIRVA